jgi:outer membrane protein TolC
MRAASLLLFALLVAPASGAAQATATLGAVANAQVPQVTLSEAIERANKVQPTVVQARANIAVADANRRVATGAWLPNFSASGSSGYLYSEGAGRVDPVTGQFFTGNTENTSFSGGLSTNWDLFTGFRRGADKDAAQAGQHAAEAGLMNAEWQQRFTTSNQFFTALAARQILDVRRAAVRRAEEQLNAAVARLRGGTATRSDSLRSVVTLGNARIQLTNAEADLTAAEAQLGRIVGYTGRVRAADDSSYYHVLTEIDTTALVATARSSAPQVLSTQATAEQARAQIATAKSTYWPQLTFNGNLSYNASSRTQDKFGLYGQRQASLTLSWPIFNRFIRERAVDNQQAQASVAEANAAEAERQVLASLITQFAALDAARSRIEVAQQSLVASQEDIRVVGERYRLGVATLVDLLVSQEGLTQAELDVVTARLDYLRTKAQLEATLGRSL